MMRKITSISTIAAVIALFLFAGCSAPKKWDVPTTLGLKVGMKVEECQKAMDKLAKSDPEKPSQVTYSEKDSTYLTYINPEKVFGRNFDELTGTEDDTEIDCVISDGKVMKVNITFASNKPAKTMDKMLGSLESGWGETVKSANRQAPDLRNYIKGDRVMSFSFFEGRTFITYCDIKKFEEK